MDKEPLGVQSCGCLWATPAAVLLGLGQRGTGKSDQTLQSNCKESLEAAILMAHICLNAACSFSVHTGQSKQPERWSRSAPSLRFGLSRVLFWCRPAQESPPSEHLRSSGQMQPFGQASPVQVKAAVRPTQAAHVIMSFKKACNQCTASRYLECASLPTPYLPSSVFHNVAVDYKARGWDQME